MKIVFMGTPRAAAVSLQRLVADGHEIVAVYSQPDRPSGRGNKITFSPVKELAVEHGFTLYQPTRIRTGEAAELFGSHGADVAVVVAYGRILPDAFLNAFPYGAVNVHFSLLPKYRGAAPVNWAIACGETETGVTTIKMDAGLDTGAILKQARTEIGAGENSIELMDRLALVGAGVLSETLSSIDDITPVEQLHDQATFAPIMKRDDGLIDWTNTATVISNRVRAFQPFPTAFTYFQNARVALWRALPVETIEDDGAGPGQITVAHGDELCVACGEGTVLRIEEIQPEGKRRMPVRDFINGVKPAPGSVFGG